jgi:hypothetical protein
LLTDAALLELCQHLVEREATRFLSWRELGVGLQVLSHERLCWAQREDAFNPPFNIIPRVAVGHFEGVGAEIEELGKTQRH